MAPLRPQILHSYRPCLRLLDAPSRSFTTSLVLRKIPGLPVFQPTPSAELDALLSTYRTNVFVPNFLPQAQQKVIYRGKKHHLLLGDDPVMVDIGDETVQMKPIDRMRDLPAMRDSFAKVLDLMGEAGGNAWENLPGLLVGLKRSRWKMRGWQEEKLVRRACFAKQEGLIMQCMRRVGLTGLAMREPGAVMEMMRAALRRAQDGGWGKEGVQRGAKFAESVWWMMQEPEHTRLGLHDPMRGPELAGILVLLNAAKAVLHGGKQDVGGHVARYVEILLAQWKNADLGTVERDKFDANRKLLGWAPVLHGMKMARQVLGEESDMGKELGIKLAREVEPMLERARQVILTQMPQEGTRRGLKLYEELSSLSSDPAASGEGSGANAV